MSNTQTIENTHTSGVYAKRDLTIVRGEGATLYDDQGNAYIDCVGGQGAANLGHAHPKVVAAISEQAQKIISVPEMFYNDTRAALLKKLTGLAPEDMDRAFLSNSGTEAVEAAFKFARFSTKRTEIIATMRGFHGRSMGALSATWNKKYRSPFQPLIPGIKHVPYNKLERLDAAIDENTAAVILEAVQGEGGVYPGDAEYLLGAQELCRERGALLIMDEIQTGFGRTGKMFAINHYDLSPDIMTVAKSMAGGVPMGATLLGERVAELSKGIHGSTFGGNPLAAAASLAALNALVDEKLPERAAELGAYFLAELQKIESPLVRGVRGMGLMLGIEIKKKVAPYLAALTERGILALPAGMTVIRFLPPLVIEKEQIDEVIVALKEILE
ncbi:MAG: aspartate aminotransferase family protein [Anaerolineae bacterium]|jgi:acetylornithine/LysW-gamma-L-lysine aminotransferase|nr:aspartate aminotransferase family protein [Anaerolineae bacterium]MBT3713974.1 aspartate aminotransferase family protein [Anaerolineae bacterium]MBT4311405.1 aspartate aminotransferase family protein [Anaerolineae bacterium]MBT4460042.1 aspartate aminotransferase family protein [Anaerolineae bacterium]MBT6324086.1 aspartate aminotransferase family protein [Anaerolineae bacterium]